MKQMLITVLFLTSFSAFAAEPANSTAAPQAKQMDPAKKEQLKSDRETMNNTCAEESKVAGCDGEKVGTGLLKCIHAYRKGHKKEFKVSESCKMAMQKFRSDKTTN